MSGSPPPPPPHGDSPKTTAGGSGLPPGKYDIFIIPEHSAGAGFLYLPSLRTNTNSFVAGFACALVMVVVGQSMAPAFQTWWANFQGMGQAGMMLLVVAVGLGSWSLGRTTSDHSRSGGGGHMPGPMPGGGGFSSAGSSPHSGHHARTPPPQPSAPPPPPPGGSAPGPDKSGGGWQQRPSQPGASRPPPETPKNSWERAREETRRKEEQRKAKEAEQKRREETAQRLKELREKEARERAQREADKARRESEAKEKEAKEREAREREAKQREEKLRKEKELRDAREKELRERLAREREERRKKLEEEKKRKEEEESQSRKSTTYAFSSVGEKTNPWPNGKPPPVPNRATASATAASPSPSPKKPPPPTARTFVSEDDAYSYRPYDQPKKSAHKKSNSNLSESSWAPSQSTARTSPPPSVRGPYSTKDPDKIVLKAVYAFMNQYAKTPASQLVSGVGSVTDGLILRITTEGLFIDDDVRGVAQREWDVKAWTLSKVEVWCPSQFLACAIAANTPPGAKQPSANARNAALFAKSMGSQRLRAAERGAPKMHTGDEADAYLTDVLRECKGSCRLGDCASNFASFDHGGGGDDAASSVSSRTNGSRSASQTGDWKARGLHLLRATIRDQEGKRYLFVISEEEGWKVAVGLQRLRRGTQVRALGVAGLSGLETKSTLEMLGWGA